MSLEGARRVDRAVRDDWETRMRVHDARVSSHDEMRIDGERRIAAWFRAGMLVLEAPVDLIGVYFPDLGLFRWWWSGKEPQLAPSRLDEAFAHAQQRTICARSSRDNTSSTEKTTPRCSVASRRISGTRPAS